MDGTHAEFRPILFNSVCPLLNNGFPAYPRYSPASVNSERELGVNYRCPSGLAGAAVHRVGVPFSPVKVQEEFLSRETAAAKMVGRSVERSDFRARYFVMAKFTLAICIGRT